MNRLVYSLAICLLFLLCTVLGAGCKPAVTLMPVSGKVTVGEQPLVSGQVTLIPVDEKATKDPCVGSIDANGEYKVFTGSSEGAPLGKYKVTVTPSMVPVAGAKSPPIPFDRKYSEVKSTPLTIEVVSNPAPGAYNLKLTK
jgi:hypothetical protein